MKCHKKEKLILDRKNDSNNHYTSLLRKNKRKNSYECAYNHNYKENNNYIPHLQIIHLEKNKSNKKNINLFKLFKYFIVLIFFNLTNSKYKIYLEIDKNNAKEPILCTKYVGMPRKIKLDSNEASSIYYSQEDDYLKFICTFNKCGITLIWGQEELPPTDPPEPSPDESEQEPDNPDPNQNESEPDPGNGRILEDSESINGDDLFRGCTTIKLIEFLSDNEIYLTSMSHTFDSCNSLEKIQNLNIDQVENLEYAFHNCENLYSLDIKGTLSNIEINTEYMFANCESLSSINLDYFSGNELINMNSMFSNCKSINSLLIGFNTEKVTNMDNLFYLNIS